MAQRRMFNKTITNNDNFLEMPDSSQNLYFHLSMNADDDGFVDNWKAIMRMTGHKEDDLKVLIAKQFVIPFESGVIVIRHWRLNNYLQKDRITPTNYQEELKKLSLDESNAYVLETNDIKNIEIEKTKKIYIEDARQKRIEAKKESDLPYSFEYKIRNAFIGKICPICNREMNATSDKNKPTIQHNKPISLGGKHELDNISVICSNCNCSIQNRVETPPYNTEEVKKIWECIGNVYTDKYSIDKNSIDKNSIDNIRHKFGTYGRVKLTTKQYEKLIEDFSKEIVDKKIEQLDEYVESNNNKNKYSNFNLVLRKAIKEKWWENQNANEYKSKIDIQRERQQKIMEDFVKGV